jgi:CheY-like chemotaxis protein
LIRAHFANWIEYMVTESLKIFVIDDSSMAVNLTVKLLREAGHEAEGINDPEQAIERLRETKPDVVVSDVMMPGINGFELCKLIRQDDILGDVRIVMASAKAYEADKNKAKKMGADGYIVKPFTMEKFNTIINTLGSMKLSAWGVRGTLPMPQEGYIRFGGHTSCYSLQLLHDRHLIFDAGSGIKALGSDLMRTGKTRITADLFITHPHWDHINAFPFFTPLYIPGNEIRVHGAVQDDLGFKELMLAQMDGTYFPVTVREFGAHLTFHEIGEQQIEIDDISVKSILLKHPGHCLGYRVDYHGRSFCYITDNELYPAESDFADEEFVETLADFCRGTNVLVHDCTYFDDEYATKVHWGHSSLSEVCRLAHLAEAERLWIHHHDPDQNDDDIARKLDICSEALQAMGSQTQAVLPYEGLSEVV